MQAPGYTLSAVFGPLSRLRALKSLLPAAAAYVCYVIVQKLVYVGHGNGDRKMGDRLGADLKAGANVYILYSWDPRFDKLQASYLEARLVDRLYAAGVPLANSDRPFGSGLKEDPGLEQLVRLSELLLGLAGFQPPERAGTAPSRTRVLPSARVLQDVVPVEPDEMPAPPTERYRIQYRGLVAEGFYAGKKTFYIQPGADFAVGERPGMTIHNTARRNGLIKFLDPIPGADNRMRVRVGLQCLSASLAAKMVTGEHVGTKVWQPIL
ncbi:hypothetical protein XI06_27190 [Bradyrhizobium sp. CCBAU 11434]|nr:hypothetical protein [Bradyrhizobium sp. CCBAU 11434]